MQKRIIGIGHIMHDVFAEILREQADIRFDLLSRDCAPDIVAGQLAAAHAYQTVAAINEINPEHRATARFLAGAPNLLVISSNGAGHDTVDVRACTEAGVIVVHQSGANANAVAEHALGLILSLSKKIGPADRQMRRALIRKRTDLIGNDVAGKTLGIVGFGNIGRRLAAICASGFGMPILACDPYVASDEMTARGVEKVDLDSLLDRADFVSVHCPLDAGTRGMIGAPQFERMKRSAFFISTARGGIHDEAALVAALASGQIAGAGLDVFDVEPPPLDHPLMRFDTVVMTPHIAGVTVEARTNIARQAALQLVTILAGGRPLRLVNPEAWPAFCARFHSIFGLTPEAWAA